MSYVHSLVLRTNDTTAQLNIANAVEKALLCKPANYVSKHKARGSTTQPQSVSHTLHLISCSFKHWTWVSSEVGRLRVEWGCLKTGYWGEQVDKTGSRKGRLEKITQWTVSCFVLIIRYRTIKSKRKGRAELYDAWGIQEMHTKFWMENLNDEISSQLGVE